MKIKLIDLARKLEVGVNSLHEHLVAKKVLDTPYNPNIRIGLNEYKMLIGEFGTTLTTADKEAIEKSLFSAPKATKPAVANKDTLENKKETPKTKPSVEEKKEQPATKKGNDPMGITVKGHIDLDRKTPAVKKPSLSPSKPEKVSSSHISEPIKAEQKDPKKELNAIKAEKPVAKSEPAPQKRVDVSAVQPEREQPKQINQVEKKNVEAETPAKSAKTEPQSVVSQKKEEEQKEKSNKNEERKSEKESSPAKEQPKSSLEKLALSEKKEDKKPIEKKESVAKTSLETSKPSEKSLDEKSSEESKKKEEEVTPFRFNRAEDVPQFQIKGKINLEPTDIGRGRRRERGGKRKRISSVAVDVKAEAAKGINESGNKGASKGIGKGASNKGASKERSSSRKQQPATSPQNQPQATGRKARRKQQTEVKQVSTEDIERKVKEVQARIAAGKRQTLGRADARKRRDMAKRQAEMEAMANNQERKVIKITEFVTVSDLANLMGVPVNEVIATCMSIDIMVSINMRLDSDTIGLIAEEFGFETEFVSADVVEAIEERIEEDDEANLVERPPVVTVMGHVDHGKTSLLDHIRNTNVIAGEAGGITQHIGAYSVKLKSGRHVTFLDTPGHQAFTAMRARGAKATDIAIIIIDATSQVMPQTKEALNHASAAGVPIVFAINKVDKPTANPNHIKEQLAQLNYLVEDWGGKYQSQEISAKRGDGVRELLDKVLLEADILELKANPDRAASGLIIESSLDKGRGYVSQILISNGTLRVGDMVLAGKYCGRVRALTNERGQSMQEVTPSMPATLLGLDGAPTAGDTFNVLENEQEARNIARRRRQLDREQDIRTQQRLTLEQIGERIKIGNFKELNLIVKGDVDGSIEALSDSFIKLSTDEIAVKVIHKAVGQISENDVDLAKASDAVIIGFQVRPNNTARKLAEQYGVEIRTYSIIYDAIDDVTSAMEGMLAPEIREQVTATLDVLQVFNIKGTGAIAGCMVKEGKIKRTDKVRVIREGIVIYTGELASLKRYKDDAKEVVAGLECGLSIKNYDDILEGDLLETFSEIEVKKKL